MLFTIIHQCFAGAEVPLAPRRNHLNTGLECIGSQLEAHLIITFAGSAVRNRVSTGFIGNLNHALGNQWAGNGGSQQVLTLIDRIGTKHRVNVIPHKFFLQIININLPYAQGLGLGASGLYLFTLSDISSKGYDLTLIGFL